MATDYFLEIEGIKGESEDKVHGGAIEVLSWSFGASNPTRRRAGKVSIQDFHFTAYSSTASEQIANRLKNSGTYIKFATLYGVQPDDAGEPFDAYVIKLSECLVSTFEVAFNPKEAVRWGAGGGGAGGAEPPPDSIDSVSLRVGGWDLKKNTKI